MAKFTNRKITFISISENDPECLFKLFYIKYRKKRKRTNTFFYPQPDIDLNPGVKQAVQQTISGVNGNKILLTRLFYCLPTVFISFQTIASYSLMASDSNSP